MRALCGQRVRDNTKKTQILPPALYVMIVDLGLKKKTTFNYSDLCFTAEVLCRFPVYQRQSVRDTQRVIVDFEDTFGHLLDTSKMKGKPV